VLDERHPGVGKLIVLGVSGEDGDVDESYGRGSSAGASEGGAAA
jgi:hypothetical protein